MHIFSLAVCLQEADYRQCFQSYSFQTGCKLYIKVDYNFKIAWGIYSVLLQCSAVQHKCPFFQFNPVKILVFIIRSYSLWIEGSLGSR